MEQPVLTVCNYVDVIGSYCYTYVSDRVCYTATYVKDCCICVADFIQRNYKCK